MSALYANEELHVVVLGAEVERLRPFAEELAQAGIPVSVIDENSPPSGPPITCAIIAERFDPNVSWEQWWEQESATATLFEEVLQEMASLSTALVVAYSSTDERKGRSEVRSTVSGMLDTLEAQGATIHGIDFTANAIEVPTSGNEELLVQRLAPFVRQRSTATSGSVFALEELRTTSIATALAISEL